ncbi:hypothetical protein RFI_13689 [Reticulomyxa filosa]|uniref:Uncharacterized protein n=1 Tax=Reticulomyxa filosa TaxID=46433 RepID=X6NBW2_RETFI|nr:hypothetical protein RFI_13689 [Reticulomyxa filosa]|eukprot:ETO23491.1 hypothetical protein RFI_13689 [Reticulomyxa filosa]
MSLAYNVESESGDVSISDSKYQKLNEESMSKTNHRGTIDVENWNVFEKKKEEEEEIKKKNRTRKQINDYLKKGLPFASNGQICVMFAVFLSLVTNVLFIYIHIQLYINILTCNIKKKFSVMKEFVSYTELVCIVVLSVMALASLKMRNCAVFVDSLQIMRSFSLFKLVQWCSVQSALDMMSGMIDHHFASKKELDRMMFELQDSYRCLCKLKENSDNSIESVVSGLIEKKKLQLQIQWINIQLALAKSSQTNVRCAKMMEFLENFRRGIIVSFITIVILVMALLSAMAMAVKLSQVAFIIEKDPWAYSFRELTFFSLLCLKLISLWNQLGGLATTQWIEIGTIYYQLFASEQGQLGQLQMDESIELDGNIKELLLQRSTWFECFVGFLMALSLNKYFLHQILFYPSSVTKLVGFVFFFFRITPYCFQMGLKK